MDSFAHYSQNASVFVGQGFLVGFTFVEVKSKHLGHIARADHFFNLCSECEVAHLSVWRCFNFIDNDAVTCNVNLDFRSSSLEDLVAPMIPHPRAILLAYGSSPFLELPPAA